VEPAFAVATAVAEILGWVGIEDWDAGRSRTRWRESSTVC
jgi:hypothetical protein